MVNDIYVNNKEIRNDGEILILKNANVFTNDKFGGKILKILKNKSVTSTKYIFINDKFENKKLRKLIKYSSFNFYCFDLNIDLNIKFIENLYFETNRKNKFLIGITAIPKTKSEFTKFKEKINNYKKIFNTIIIIDNNKIYKIKENIPEKQIEDISIEIFSNIIKGIIEIVTIPYLMGLDYPDMKIIFETGGIASVSIVKSNSKNRIEEIIEQTFENILLDFDHKKLKDAIVHITGGNNITLEEIQNCGNGISKLLNKDSNVIWGCEIKEDNKNLVNVFTIFTGAELK